MYMWNKHDIIMSKQLAYRGNAMRIRVGMFLQEDVR